MKLTFLGAAREVTGSCYLLEYADKRVIIDCGLEQGKDIYENKPIPVPANKIDAVFLTHAHIDHSGKIPMLCKNGFNKTIYTSVATGRLCSIMLLDSAHIQESDAEWRNKKAKRAGDPPVEPLYTIDDATKAISLIKGVDHNKTFEALEGLTACFTDAGHLLGSSSITFCITENGVTKKLVFSGDIGNTDQPILNDPVYLTEADYVIMESTYGDRSHGPRPDYEKFLVDVCQRTFDRGGNVVIPSFAVGRTQELLYILRDIKQKSLISGHDGFTVYVDSPLANEATNVFDQSDIQYFDKEMSDLIKSGVNPLQFEGLRRTVTSDESKLINFDKTPSVIISASGMCDAGRIRHHLKHNLWRSECTVLFVGFQSNGTLGRNLLEGAEKVKLFGEPIEVKAEICQMNAISGHADNTGLMKWAASFDPKPTRYFITHGEEEAALTFAGRVSGELGGVTQVPYNGEVWDLIENALVCEGNKVRLSVASGQPRENELFAKLKQAQARLNELIAGGLKHDAKQLDKLIKRINTLCDKWEE